MGGLYRLRRDTAAASSAEYAILLAIVGAGIALAAMRLGDTISCSVDRSSTIIETGEVPGMPNYGKSNPQGQANGRRPRC